MLLEQRGVTKQARSGLERFFPAAFAYELPAVAKPPVALNPDSIQIIPAARIRFSEEETSDLVEFGLANQLSLNSVVAAAILLTEWELRNTPHLPIPYVYPVDVRYLLTPAGQCDRQHPAVGVGELSRRDPARYSSSSTWPAASWTRFVPTWPTA